MRPDEEANRADIERDKNFRSNLKTGINTAANIAIGTTAARALPFLSEFIPADLAMKGLSKVSPKLADFLKKGQAMGLNVKEGIDYIKKSIAPNQEEAKQEQTNEPPKEKRNIIEQYSPGLAQYLQTLIKKGSKPSEAAIKAKKFLDPKHQKIISQIEKDHKTDWASIVEAIFGSEGVSKTPTQPNNFQQGAQQPQAGGDKWAQIANSLQNLLNS